MAIVPVPAFDDSPALFSFILLIFTHLYDQSNSMPCVLALSSLALLAAAPANVLPALSSLMPLASLPSYMARRNFLSMSADESAREPDMALLASRIDMMRSGMCDCRLVVLETMVPGQRYAITAPPPLVELVTLGVSPVVALGRRGAAINSFGVEITLEGPPTYLPVVPGIHPEGTAEIVLVAGRLCEVTEMAPLQETDPRLWLGRTARARWFDLQQRLEDAEGRRLGAPMDDVLARSQALGPRVLEWCALVRSSGLERKAGQLSQALADMGPIPDPERADARALWVAGLINPLPALGARHEPLLPALPMPARPPSSHSPQPTHAPPTHTYTSQTPTRPPPYPRQTSRSPSHPPRRLRSKCAPQQ